MGIRIYLDGEGRDILLKTGYAIHFESPKVDEQNLHFPYLRFKKWVRSCSQTTFTAMEGVEVRELSTILNILNKPY